MIKCILIEAGHGRNNAGRVDVGAVGNGKTERDMVREICRHIIDILSEKTKHKGELEGVIVQGVGVETEANINAKINYINSVKRENRIPNDQTISLHVHMNSVVSSIPRGFEIWMQKGVRKGKINLAGQLVEAWKKYNILPLRPTPIRSTANHHFRGLYNDNLTHNAPLIEVGFISNPSDVNLIVRNYKRTAEAIAHGLMNYIRNL